jgi:hypothetical protein
MQSLTLKISTGRALHKLYEDARCTPSASRAERDAAWKRARAAYGATIDEAIAEVLPEGAKVFDDLSKLGKAIAKFRTNTTGRAGGWIYRNGRPICQGWAAYGAHGMHGRYASKVVDTRGESVGRYVLDVVKLEATLEDERTPRRAS